MLYVNNIGIPPMHRHIVSINQVNGLIGMNFTRDGAHYIDHKIFFDKLETFATNDVKEPLATTA